MKEGGGGGCDADSTHLIFCLQDELFSKCGRSKQMGLIPDGIGTDATDSLVQLDNTPIYTHNLVLTSIGDEEVTET